MYLGVRGVVRVEGVEPTAGAMGEHGRQRSKASLDQQRAAVAKAERKSEFDHDVCVAVATLDILEHGDRECAVAQAELDVRPQLAGVVTIVGADDLVAEFAARPPTAALTALSTGLAS